ncbi:MAG: isoleucine--tRNA ligase [Candidatus Thermoplasmatota archaeon]|nr:isoleucine--tRNA ligase [Candidatus Thermoplasmatota archaeon]
MIQAASQKYKPKAVEKNMLSFWKDQDIFNKSITQRKDNPPYIFLEGPPTANGMPHPGHVLTRVIKDLVLRYQTMNGHYILRKAGWDTHGLPVEIEVEKKLGLNDKQDIEAYGLKKFNNECKNSVFSYEHAWVDLTERIGFWLDMDNPYITLKNDYIESVWWSLQQAWNKKLLYKGHKVVPYCPRCGTALSAHEVAQGYKTVKDPSIFVKFKLKNENTYFLAWTTTPWTLLSNVALAVHPDELYIKVRYHGEEMILAEQRAATLLKGEDYDLLDGFKGKELEHKEYEPLFPYAHPDKKAWYIICADFVTMGDGTGIVHIAPAFGEDDYTVGKSYDLPVVQLVKLDGTFKDEVELWKGEFVKDADPKIIKYLEENRLLEGVQEYEHEYPFCWRCDSPLLYYAMESWFIGMSQVQKELTNNNNQINWYPKHLQQGRFGAFINDVKDWALSRNRYWGTPLPIWTCENKECNHQICVGSVDELRKLSDNFTDDYDLHKPYVDELTIHCPKCNRNMVREPEVIDCWYDSGSAFFAQWHYPFENKEEFDHNFPVDFISEALDQTRGWFYSLLAISTILFNKPPYKNVLTLGLVLDKDSQKMSKSKRNYVNPDIILDREGADALRWYLISSNAPWNSTRFYEAAVKETLAKFILTVWNSYNFFTTYASIDSFDYDNDQVEFEKRSSLDKWILSRYNKLVKTVRSKMKTFNTHKAARVVEQFVIDDFSNWYLRRSRKRLWEEEKTIDKLAAYTTIYEIFLGISKLIAPFTPFITEEIYQNLRTSSMSESIHLCDYPTVETNQINDELEYGMKQIKGLVEVGRALRSKIGINVRYPLPEAMLVCDKSVEEKIKNLLDLLVEEVNVKKISFERKTDKYINRKVKPNFSVLGPRLKEKMGSFNKVIAQMDSIDLYETIQKQGSITLEIDGEEIAFSKDDFFVEEEEKEHIARTQAGDAILLLDTELTKELEAEGFARELVRRIQSMRKELNLDVEQHIQTQVTLPDDQRIAVNDWKEYIANETRSKPFEITSSVNAEHVKTWKINDVNVTIGITP